MICSNIVDEWQRHGKRRIRLDLLNGMRITALTTVADDSRTMLSCGLVKLAPLSYRSYRRCRSPFTAKSFLCKRRGRPGLGCFQEINSIVCGTLRALCKSRGLKGRQLSLLYEEHIMSKRMRNLLMVLGAAGTAAVLSAAPAYGLDRASDLGRFGPALDSDAYGSVERDQIAQDQAAALSTPNVAEHSGIAGGSAPAMEGTQGVTGFRARMAQRLEYASDTAVSPTSDRAIIESD
jgi:hypothetical protein